MTAIVIILGAWTPMFLFSLYRYVQASRDVKRCEREIAEHTANLIRINNEIRLHNVKLQRAIREHEHAKHAYARAVLHHRAYKWYEAIDTDAKAG